MDGRQASGGKKKRNMTSHSRASRRGRPKEGVDGSDKAVRTRRGFSSGCNRSGRRPRPLPPARAQRPWVPRFVSLDVEFIHLAKDKRPGKPKKQQLLLPGEVCVVDEDMDVLLHTKCNPGLRPCDMDRFIGGVPVSKVMKSPTIETVREQLVQLICGCVLVGHGIQSDLRALALKHPAERTVDTLQIFQNKAGGGRSLKFLAQQHLDRRIQSSSRRHCACEDACAVMELLKRCILTHPEDLGNELHAAVELRMLLSHRPTDD